MAILYNLFIQLYYLAVLLAMPFNKKAYKWHAGRKGLLKEISKRVDKDARTAWFHCSSLGEFEQGRPVIEAFKKEYPDYKILITFYSPSGYEIRKDYKYADYVFYLPLDTAFNARRLVKYINPDIVFFVKYEYWYHIIKNISKAQIPVFLISAIFRKEQLFFRWWGSWYKKILHFFTHIFVQDQASKDLLIGNNVKNVTLSGDTRFDRVYELINEAREVGYIQEFKDDKTLIVAGSTWENDEHLLCRYINEENLDEVKYIIAPHEVDDEHIRKIEANLKVSYIRYSAIIDGVDLKNKKVIIIDNIGMLSALYKYGDIAYIGGGFGKGIHNTLEAATYGRSEEHT